MTWRITNTVCERRQPFSAVVARQEFTTYAPAYTVDGRGGVPCELDRVLPCCATCRYVLLYAVPYSNSVVRNAGRMLSCQIEQAGRVLGLPADSAVRRGWRRVRYASANPPGAFAHPAAVALLAWEHTCNSHEPYAV